MLLQQLISGFATGGLYALAALGLVLTYKTSDVVNFAQGEMAMFSTFIAYTTMTSYGMSYWEAFILALLFASVLGFIVERFFIRPIQNAPVLSLLIVTLGLMMIVNGIAGWAFGFETHSFPAIVGGGIKNFWCSDIKVKSFDISYYSIYNGNFVLYVEIYSCWNCYKGYIRKSNYCKVNGYCC
ncbi:branched-chain amino acid ABC transporter permease [Thermoanaerobacter wiegelii]|uniref:branched-chain amino acid ABC transporter permease n=1 Tax=Thermoanaerobacter wiegelii TaxID=46354 RepID=UPI0002D25D21|nr:branched-chain amino acid ABC transporter permease [Thermoanaerobacter wiegelii]